MKGVPLTDDQKFRAIELYTKNKLSTNQVARAIGISQISVLKILQTANVPTRKRSVAQRLRKQADGDRK